MCQYRLKIQLMSNKWHYYLMENEINSHTSKMSLIEMIKTVNQ